MSTMTFELDAAADVPGNLDLPEPSPDEAATAIEVTDGVSALGSDHTLQAETAADREFGDLDEAVDPAPAATPVAEDDGADLLGETTDQDRPGKQAAGVDEARDAVRAALDEPGDADLADGGEGGRDHPNPPTGGSGGNGGNGESGERDDDAESGDEGEERREGEGGEEIDDAAEDGPAPLKVPENFGFDPRAAHQGRRIVYSGTEVLADGSQLRIEAKVMGHRHIGGWHSDGRPMLGVRVVGEGMLTRDNHRVLEVEELTMTFPYDTGDTDLAALGRQQKEGDDWRTSRPLAERTAEATVAAMEAMRANRAAARANPATAEVEQPDRVNEQTRDFIEEILGAYPNMDQLTQAEGTEIAESLLHAYQANWHGTSGRDIHARRENVKMARDVMTGRPREEIARERDMADWTVGSRLRSITSWMQARPDSKSGAQHVRRRLTEILESKTRQA